MTITEQFKKKIEKIYNNYKKIKAEYYQVSLNNSFVTKRKKHILYGKIVAYEEIIKIIQED